MFSCTFHGSNYTWIPHAFVAQPSIFHFFPIFSWFSLRLPSKSGSTASCTYSLFYLSTSRMNEVPLPFSYFCSSRVLVGAVIFVPKPCQSLPIEAEIAFQVYHNKVTPYLVCSDTEFSRISLPYLV